MTVTTTKPTCRHRARHCCPTTSLGRLGVGLTLLTAFILTSQAHAAPSESSKRLVVKTFSRYCDTSALDLRGSGTLFKLSASDTAVYVLTSEHVLLQGTKDHDRVCHTVSYQSVNAHGDLVWEDAAAELVATDWQSGLAILKLVGDTAAKPVKVPAYQSLIALKPAGESFDVAGLPYGSEGELKTDAGRFSASTSFRHLMPNGSPVFELQDADGEFGMSGGPVFDRNGQLTGLVSHQFLLQRQGRTSAIGVFGEENAGTPENHLILVRGSDLAAWIESAIKDDFAPGFVRSLEDQTSGGDAVYAGNMKFTAIPQDKECTTADVREEGPGPGGIGGVDPVGIGGVDPVGIGGVDPVGIGGDGAKLPKSISVGITLDRDTPSFAGKSRWNIPRLESWHRQVYDAALRGETIEVPSIIYRDPKNPDKGISRVCVRSLEEFFRKVIVDGSSAVTYRRGGAGTINPEPMVQSLLAEGQRLLAATTSIHAGSDRNKKLFLIRYGRMYGSLLASVDNWSLVKPSDLDPLQCVTSPQCPHRKEWSELFEDPALAGNARDMLSAMRQACNLLKSLTAPGDSSCRS